MNAVYSPLNEHETRFLEITLGEPTTSAVECRLVTISLSNKPKYTALSYVWGDTSVTEDIMVNSKLMTVTRSLVTALRHLNQHWQKEFPDRNIKEFLLWADAVCINQSDLIEREQQVKLMRSIYQDAELVFAWLGSGNSDVHLGFQTFSLLDEEFSRLRDRDALNETPALEWLEKHECLWHEDDSHKPLSNKAWRSVWTTLQLPYWNRIWIFQEICLAQRMILLYEHSSLDYASLVSASLVLSTLKGIFNQSSYLRPKFISDDIWLALSSPFWDYDQIIIPLHVKGWLSSETPLQTLTQWRISLYALDMNVTDARDYIYGLLGLTSLEIEPKYFNTTLGDTLTRYVELWLRQFRTIDLNASVLKTHQGFRLLANELFFLGIAGTNLSSKADQIPSWAPVFNLSPKSLFCAIHGAADKGIFLDNEDQSQILDQKLCVTGITIDTVFKSGVAPSGTHNDGSLFEYLADFITRFPTYITGISSLRAAFQVLLRETAYEASITTIKKALAFIRMLILLQDGNLERIASGDLEQINEVEKQFARLGLGIGAQLSPKFTRHFCPGSDLDILELFVEMLDPNADNTSLPLLLGLEVFKIGTAYKYSETKSGYLGLFPAKSEPGDLVCILKGCQTPVVLQKTENGHVHIGSCWILGFMEGEAAGLVKRGEMTVLRFELS